MPVAQSPVALLLITGSLLGLTFPLGKLAAAAGISPFIWTFLIAFGAGSLLFLALKLQRGRLRISGRYLRYYFIAGTVSYVVPNLIVFFVILKLGAGFTSITFTLSPVFTLLLSFLLRMRSLNGLGVAGICVGFVGGLIVALTRGEVGHTAHIYWVILAFGIPLSLAIGNIYRTYDWPPDAEPIELAAGSNLAAAIMLVPLCLVFVGGFPVETLLRVPDIATIQFVSAAVMLYFHFRLQIAGGPVYLSQISYVGAAVGLFAGVLFLGETYPVATWIGALITCVGIALTTLAMRTKDAD